jgi:hypothetical protein
MENPATWTETEKVIHAALGKWQNAVASGMVGASAAASIAHALREAGLLKEGE